MVVKMSNDEKILEKSVALVAQLNKAARDIEDSNFPHEQKQDLKSRIERTSDFLKTNTNSIILESAVNTLVMAQILLESNKIGTSNAVTGLPNRHVFNRDLSAIVNRIQRDEEGRVHFALLYADADFFKKINDEISHSAGDDALIQIGETLSSKARADEQVYHWGGDEFAVLLRDVKANNEEEAKANFAKALERFKDSFRENIFEYNGEERPLTMSMGLHIITKDDISPEDSVEDINKKVQDIADKSAYEDKLTKNERQQHIWGIIKNKQNMSPEFDIG